MRGLRLVFCVSAAGKKEAPGHLEMSKTQAFYREIFEPSSSVAVRAEKSMDDILHDAMHFEKTAGKHRQKMNSQAMKFCGSIFWTMSRFVRTEFNSQMSKYYLRCQIQHQNFNHLIPVL